MIFKNQTENTKYKDENEVAEFTYAELSISGKIWVAFWIGSCFWQYLGVKYK